MPSPLRFQALKRQAQMSCKKRGHYMVWLQNFGHNGGDGVRGNCRNCQCYVQVLTHPQPNEIDIGGDALALGCADSPPRAKLVQVSPNPERKPALRDMTPTELRLYIRKLERRLRKLQHVFMDVVNLTEQYAYEDMNIAP